MPDQGVAVLSDISALVRTTQGEESRQAFVSALRKHVMVNMSATMRQDYEDHIKPHYLKVYGAEPKTPRDVKKAM